MGKNICSDDVGSRIRLIRKQQGISQQELAKRAQVAQSAISYIESGGKRPNIATVRMLAAALGVPAGVLLAEEAEPAQPAEAPRDLRRFLEQENIWFGNQRLTDADVADILVLLDILKRQKGED